MRQTNLQVGRRRFLFQSSLAVAGFCALRPSTGILGASELAKSADADFWETVRGQFELSPDVTQLSCFYLLQPLCAGSHSAVSRAHEQ